jgi:methylmalonyl-CoA/ethylmalonyl-CoA epimerase
MHEHESLPVEVHPQGGPGYSLHHVGHLVADIETAARHFQQACGYLLESDIIEDPLQSAYVQFLRLPQDTQWLELIAPNGPDSKLSRALQQGGGLHHLCYAVRDLDAACQSLRTRGCLMFAAPVPARAFPGRRIAWFRSAQKLLLELLETGGPPMGRTTGIGTSECRY